MVVLGGFLGGSAIYQEMLGTLRTLAGAQAFLVPVSRGEWTTALTSRGWARILLKLRETVQEAAQGCNGCRVILVGHSAGGVMGRLFLSPEPFRGIRFNGLESVQHLITLGSPHGNLRGARLRRWVDQSYPGAFFAPEVTYTTVAGRAIQGSLQDGLRARVARILYLQLSGNGGEWGDGLVPLTSARLEGARNLVLDAVAHAPIGGRRWYGTSSVVREWWGMSMAEPDQTCDVEIC